MNTQVDDSVFGSVLLGETFSATTAIDSCTAVDPFIAIIPKNPRGDFTNTNTICLAIPIEGDSIPDGGLVIPFDTEQSDHRYELADCGICGSYDKCAIVPTYGDFGSTPFYLTTSLCSDCFGHVTDFRDQFEGHIDQSEMLIEMLSTGGTQNTESRK